MLLPSFKDSAGFPIQTTNFPKMSKIEHFMFQISLLKLSQKKSKSDSLFSTFEIFYSFLKIFVDFGFSAHFGFSAEILEITHLMLFCCFWRKNVFFLKIQKWTFWTPKSIGKPAELMLNSFCFFLSKKSLVSLCSVVKILKVT